MTTYRPIFFLLTAFFALVSCSVTPRYQTPLDTLKAYTIAIKKKDVETMKKLLSEATIRMHEEQARQQNVSIDEIIQRETLFNPTQTSLKYRNQKIDGSRATIEVENSFGVWDTVPFVLENGIWKIDKQGFAEQLRRDIEDQNEQQIDDLIDQNRVEPDATPDPGSPIPTISPAADATPDPAAPTGSPAAGPTAPAGASSPAPTAIP